MTGMEQAGVPPGYPAGPPACCGFGGKVLEIVNTGAMVAKYGIRLTKSLGQNFLTDINIIDKIVEAGEVTRQDLVLEIGAGIGGMTLQLAKAAGRVVAVEIDRRLIPALEEVLADCDNTEIILGDILKTDLHAFVKDWPGPLKVISNLPYYITTPIIMHLLESDIPWNTLVFMVQKEVAQRLSAPPGIKDYSALSVAIRCLSEPKLCFTVSKNCFVPKPEVDSAVVRLRKTVRPELDGVDMGLFRKVVRASFSQRRKTIVNSLGAAPWIVGGKEKLREVLGKMAIPENTRAECLSLEQFAGLTRLLVGMTTEENEMKTRLPMARYLDHAVLKPEMSRDEAKEAILLGIAHKVRTVCVRPCDVVLAAQLCEGTETEVSCVLAFPHGCTTPAMKAFEAGESIRAGTREIDMVANYGFIRSGLRDEVLRDIRAVVDVARPAGVLVKVILETCTLSAEQIRMATEVAVEAGADFVKTSTGFHQGGATAEAVTVMMEAAAGRIKVKASGGIRTLADANRFLDLGCERLGVGYGTTPALCGPGEGDPDAGY